jgi:hypothetical protein
LGPVVPDRRCVGSSVPYTPSLAYSLTACHTITMAMKVMKAVKAMKVMKVMKASKAQKMGRAGSVAQEQKQKPKLWKALGCPRLGSVAMQDPRKPTDSELEAIRKKKTGTAPILDRRIARHFRPEEEKTYTLDHRGS